MTANAKRCPSPDWPYEDDLPMFLPGPGYYWECPDGTCECRPVEEGEPRQLTVLLCDEHARPMPNARCRVLHAGRVLNEGTPNADAEGWLSVTVTRPLRTVTLEWAPPDTPLAPRFPFRWRYHVDLEEEASEKHACARRLHNIGFSRHQLLEENVKEFQRAFGYDEITGKPEDIREDLIKFHDEGGIPPLAGSEEDTEQPGPDAGVVLSMAFLAAKDANKGKTPKKKKKDPVPRKTPPQTNKPAGGKGIGTARPRERGKLTLRVRSLFSQPGRKCRWGGEDSHPVEEALIELFDAQMNVVPAFAVNKSPKTSRKSGVVTLQLGGIPDGEYVLKLNPPDGHALRPVSLGPIRDETRRDELLAPVGPNDNHSTGRPNHTRFRFLEIRLVLKKGGMDMKETALGKGMKHPDAVVAHGAVVCESESLLQVDWKPDWVQCGFTHGTRKIRSSRIHRDRRAIRPS